MDDPFKKKFVEFTTTTEYKEITKENERNGVVMSNDTTVRFNKPASEEDGVAFFHYPVELEWMPTSEIKSVFMVTFPDLPYAFFATRGVTCGETKEEALLNAVDYLREIIESLIREKKDIPVPSPSKGREIVPVGIPLAYLR